jgi:hypothetical protein
VYRDRGYVLLHFLDYISLGVLTMNKILTELKKIMTDSIKEYLPEVSFDRLEDNAVT